jgi:hypothetical protein
VIFAAAAPEVIATFSVSLVAGFAWSYTRTFAIPACVVERVAEAFPPLTATVFTEDAPSHKPVVVAKVTLAMEAALTLIVSVSLNFMAVVVSLEITTPLSRCSSIANVAAVADTSIPCVAVAPRAAAVKVAEPAPVPVIVALNVPPVPVVPDAGVIVTLPPPALVKVTGAPEMRLPPPSFAVTVHVAVELPSSGSAVPDSASSTLDPVIWMGICVVTDPAVAVIVAVRFVRFSIFSCPPVLNTKVAGVTLLVTTLPCSRIPVSVANVTVTPDNTTFESLNAFTVIVAGVEPSDFIDVGEAERLIDAGVGGASVVPQTVMLRADSLPDKSVDETL